MFQPLAGKHRETVTYLRLMKICQQGQRWGQGMRRTRRYEATRYPDAPGKHGGIRWGAHDFDADGANACCRFCARVNKHTQYPYTSQWDEHANCIQLLELGQCIMKRNQHNLSQAGISFDLATKRLKPCLQSYIFQFACSRSNLPALRMDGQVKSNLQL